MNALSKPPMVSVIIPTHNRAPYVGQAVESALLQNYPNLEILVVDDGSTDDTRQVLSPYFDFIQYIYQENQGVAMARNTGIHASRGQYIALLDSDDLWLSGKLQFQVKFLDAHPEVGMSASHALPIDRTGQLISDLPLYPFQTEGMVRLETIVLKSPLPVNTLLIRRECLPSPLPFTPGIRFGEDWEMCLRIAARYPVWFIAEPLAAVRIHDNQTSLSLPDQQQVNLKLNDRLHVLHEFFMQEEVVNHQDLQSRAKAIEYVFAAIPSYVNRDFNAAQQRLSTALRLDSSTWQDGTELIDLILHYVNQLARRRCDEAALCFLEDMFTHLPTEVKNPSRLSRIVYTRTHIALAFKHYERLDFIKVRSHLRQAVLYDPACLKNRGVLSIYVRSLGRQLWKTSAPVRNS